MLRLMELRGWVVCIAVICAPLPACTDPNKHIWVTHCEGPAFRDVTKSSTYGSYPTGLVAKVSDNLILAPPTNAAPTYLGPDPPSTRCTRPEDLPENAYVGFFIVLSPTGYDATRPIQQSRAQDRVKVTLWDKKHGGILYPARVEQRPYPYMQQPFTYLHRPFKHVYGLRCYAEGSGPCFGNVLPGDSPDFYMGSTWSTTGRISAEYASTDYPEVDIHWEIATENLPRWKEIASLVATRLRDWNTLRQVDTAVVAPSSPASESAGQTDVHSPEVQ